LDDWLHGCWFVSTTSLEVQRLSPATRIEFLSTFLRVHDDVERGQQIDTLGAWDDVEAMHDLNTGSYTIRRQLVLETTMAGGLAVARNARQTSFCGSNA
jgi:hypothetical protein